MGMEFVCCNNTRVLHCDQHFLTAPEKDPACSTQSYPSSSAATYPHCIAALPDSERLARFEDGRFLRLSVLIPQLQIGSTESLARINI